MIILISINVITSFKEGITVMFIMALGHRINVTNLYKHRNGLSFCKSFILKVAIMIKCPLGSDYLQQRMHAYLN